MRPLQLVIEGFRSFAERTEIDWRDRRLVGVVGPIGSGKTSILDAIAFALYGKTPVFERENKTLIRHGRSHARIELLFAADGERWRAVRVIRRRGASQHALYLVEDGETLGAAVAEKERDVTEKIEQLLGLDFPTFCRSVLLAQNRFAEFLHASATERDRVLRGVFGFDRLEDMQRRARQRGADMELEVRELEGRLRGVEEDRERLAAARRAAVASKEREDELETEAEAIRELSRRREEAGRALTAARRRREELAGWAKQLPAAELADEELRAVDLASDTLSAAQNALRKARENVAGAEKARVAVVEEVGTPADLARAESRLEAWREAAARQSRQREEEKRLLEESEASLRKLAEVEAAAETKTAAARQSQSAAEERAARLAATREQLAEARRVTGGHEVLAQARTELRQLEHEHEDLERRRQEERRTEERRAAAEKELAVAVTADEEATVAARAAEREHQEAREADQRASHDLHRVEHAEMAATLARTLEPGKPCPVCDQPVESVQGRMMSIDIERARAMRQKAADRLNAAVEALRRLESVAAQRREARDNATRRHREAEREHAAAEKQRAAHERLFREREKELGTLLGEGDPAVLLDAAEARLGAAEERLREHEREAREATEAQRTAEHELALFEERLRGQRAAVHTFEERRTALAAELAATAERLALERAALEDVLGMGDPEENLVHARRRLTTVEDSLEAARLAERAAAEKLEIARHAAETARRKRDRLVQRLAGLAGQLDGLGEEMPAAEDLEPRQLDRAVRRRFDQQSRDAAAAEEEAKANESARESARREITSRLGLDPEGDFDTALTAARAARHRDAAAVEEIESRLERAATVQEELAETTARRDLYRRLAEDLTASNFLRYLLEQERAALAELGSERFEMLSEGRYRFTEDGHFNVADLHHAGAERRADTLSGGETFLASLALALALAEKVTATGGRLDAFFLDEGFGSLDPEHLQLAMEGIERLVADSPDRLVTIVSHVPEMRERIEDLIELDKDPKTGRTIVVRGASYGGRGGTGLLR